MANVILVTELLKLQQCRTEQKGFLASERGRCILSCLWADTAGGRRKRCQQPRDKSQGPSSADLSATRAPHCGCMCPDTGASYWSGRLWQTDMPHLSERIQNLISETTTKVMYKHCRGHTECTWGSVAPVHQFVLSLYHGAQLCGPVAVLLLVHEEVDALPHQILLYPAEHVLVAQQHLQHWREAVGCTWQGGGRGSARGSHMHPPEQAYKEAPCQAHKQTQPEAYEHKHSQRKKLED